MSEFNLQIVTADGVSFDGMAERVVARTSEGDIGILKNHENYLAPLKIGKVAVLSGGNERIAACSGGFISVTDGTVRIIATTFEWADEINPERANLAKEKAEEIIKNEDDALKIRRAEIKLQRSLNRIKVSNMKTGV